MADWGMKRFWTSADVAEVEGGYTVELDGRPVKTPAKSRLVVPTRALASALAAEWDAQDKDVDPAKMPLTRLSNSAIDKVAVQHDEVAALIADYAGSDLLCYRADRPEGLVARQAEIWDAYLAWGASHLGLELVQQVGIMPIEQPQEARDRALEMTRSLSAFELTGFHDLVSLTGSWILGRAAFEGAFDVDALWDAANLDALWQEQQWGADEEAIELRAAKGDEFLTAQLLITLSQDVVVKN